MKKKPKAKKQTTPTQHPLDLVFEKWYSEFGCRFYSPEGHKEYQRYAFLHGMLYNTIVSDFISQG